jgi:hypothetical protein
MFERYQLRKIETKNKHLIANNTEVYDTYNMSLESNTSHLFMRKPAHGNREELSRCCTQDHLTRRFLSVATSALQMSILKITRQIKTK